MNHSFLKTSLLSLVVIGLLSLNFTQKSAISEDVLGIANPLLGAATFNVTNDLLQPKAMVPTSQAAGSVTVVYVVANTATVRGNQNNIALSDFGTAGTLNLVNIALGKLD